MFDRVYMDILDMSKTASIVILIVLLVRLLLKKTPKIFSYVLWAVVIFRLLCPMAIETPVSLVPQLPSTSSGYTLADEPIDFAGAGIAAYQAVGDALNGGLGIQHVATTEKSEDGMTRYVSTDWWSVWILFGKYVWVVGMAAMVAYSVLSYWRIRKKVRIAVPLRLNILVADDIKSPFVIGFVKPKIYLPCNLGEKEQEYIILHEQHHIRRFDHIIKALAFLALTIHWFNPLVWVAFILACKDMEMSCDEAVIRQLGSDVRADYSASLLTLATGRRIIAGTPLAFGEGDTKGRIKNLSKWKKPAIWVLVLVIIICLILGVCLLTDRASRHDQHIGVTFYYGKVTEQDSEGDNPCIHVLCNDGSQKVFYYKAGNEDVPSDLTGKHIKIRARLQELTGDLFTTQVKLVPDAWFDNLDAAIQNAILSHHSYERDQDILECASFFTYSSEGGGPAGSNKINIVTEYGIVYHQDYRLDNGVLVEEGGCNVPTVLTFRVDDYGHYYLAEYWEPRDGNYYSEDIKAKYPTFVWPDTQKNLFEQKIAIFNQVMDGFQIGPEVVIDHLITDICDRERWAGSFDDLMLMCELQREILEYYRTDTLAYCFTHFENGNQNDLRGQVMAYVCSDILEAMGQKQIEGWSWQRSGQDWFDAFTQDTPNWQQFLLQGYSQNISFGSVELEGENGNITQIDLHNGHNGEHTYISDPEEIESIINFMTLVSGKNPTSSKGYYGWTYSLKFMSGDTEILSMGFGDDETLNYGIYTDGYPCRYELNGIALKDVVSFLCQFDQSDHEWGSRYVYPSVNWGIQLKAENATSNGAKITLIQEGGYLPNRLIYGANFNIQKYENSQWVDVEPLEELIWTTVAYSVPLNDSVTWNIDWSKTFGTLEPGLYRFCKGITDHRAPGENDDATFYAEFEIS